jgi:hypothetical protein
MDMDEYDTYYLCPICGFSVPVEEVERVDRTKPHKRA